MSDEEKKARRENFIKELMVSNEWTEEKAREFASTKSAVLSLGLDLQTLPEVMPLLLKYGVLGDTIEAKLVIPMAWLSTFKAEVAAKLGPAYLDKTAYRAARGAIN